MMVMEFLFIEKKSVSVMFFDACVHAHVPNFCVFCLWFIDLLAH